MLVSLETLQPRTQTWHSNTSEPLSSHLSVEKITVPLPAPAPGVLRTIKRVLRGGGWPLATPFYSQGQLLAVQSILNRRKIPLEDVSSVIGPVAPSANFRLKVM